MLSLHQHVGRDVQVVMRGWADDGRIVTNAQNRIGSMPREIALNQFKFIHLL